LTPNFKNSLCIRGELELGLGDKRRRQGAPAANEVESPTERIEFDPEGQKLAEDANPWAELPTVQTSKVKYVPKIGVN